MIFQLYTYIEFKEKISSFINQGPRFTALNGQELCERIQMIEKELNKEVRDCTYFVSHNSK